MITVFKIEVVTLLSALKMLFLCSLYECEKNRLTMQVHIPLLIICLILCLLPLKEKWREKWILPICILLITVYMAIRYDYGLDFWSYYLAWSDTEHRTGVTESLFWLFSSIFPQYYMLVAATSILLMGAIYFWVKKFIPPQYYALFFLCFMCIPGMCFSMMTAMRSVMAFVIVTWGIYNYYIKSERLALYSSVVLVATLMHNSVIVFLLFPFIGHLIIRVKSYLVFVILIFFTIFSFTGIAQDISTYLFGMLQGVSNVDADYYSGYAAKYVSNINGAIIRSTMLFPMFYICKFANIIKDKTYGRFYILSVIYMLIYTLSLDFEYRFTLYLYIYFIIALCYCLTKMKLLNKLIAILPMIAFCIFQLYSYYNLMQAEMFGDYSEGNFFIYETIFDNLPLI